MKPVVHLIGNFEAETVGELTLDAEVGLNQ
jgi:hypothetical protein